ncbi:MAG TPA: hypothetical protein VFV38_02750, partial [Ktedonobacteraceae bacterium]|nr:hypothetical protein [Ktedonobacteraceae bacterium]
MGMTLAFYSADANELVALFAAGADCDEQDEETFFAQLDTYPVADFSLHLSIPEDLDNLCQALREHNPLIPLIFRDVLVEQVWDDGP